MDGFPAPGERTLRLFRDEGLEMIRRLTPLLSASAMFAAVSATLGVAPAAAQSPGMVYDVDWTGPYVGLQFGRSIADMSSGDDGTGSAFGLRGGYRNDFGSFVLGGELQYDWTHLDLGDGQGSVDGLGRIKVDAGYGVGQWLFYGTFGATHAAAEFEGDDYSEWGWLAGFGVDYQLNSPVAIGFEVQHHGFGELGDTGRDFDATTVEAGITFRF
jgi:opacity protein-like surface antigen